jgi:hypothetical protein
MARAAFLALVLETEYHAHYSMLWKTKNKPAGLVMVMILCVCVAIQMLGVPVTLLNPAAEPDTGGGSIQEGFSILPSLVPIVMSGQASTLVVQFEPLVHDVVLTVVPFHPPV